MKTASGTVLITEEEIRRRISELGRRISADYATRGVTLVGILKGSFVFLADLMRAISPELRVEIDFIAASSYGDSTTSSGSVLIEKDITLPIAGKDVVIVEDVIDFGTTLAYVYNLFFARGAASLRVATLLLKPGNSAYKGPLHYVGFEIPNTFVVGFGLDYAQRYRNLPDIRVIDEA
jgi:hypoxanthine phosphoribosyltransferase